MTGVANPIRVGPARHFLPGIESMRGIAALCVAWGHCTLMLTLGGGAARGRIVEPLIDLSGTLASAFGAVIVFFVMSGFVLSLMIESASPRSAARGYVNFLIRRVLRIYPAHLAALALFAPIAFLLFRLPMRDSLALAAATPPPHWWFDGTIYGHPHLGELLRTAGLFDNYYNAVTWSLRVEILACLFVPFFVALSRRGRLGLDMLALALLGAAASRVNVDTHPDSVFLYLPAFYLGCMVRTHGRRAAAMLASWRYGPAVAVALCYAILIVPNAYAKIEVVKLSLVLEMSVGAFGLVALVAWAAPSALARLLLQPRVRQMGRVSFSFYLWHWPIFCAFGHGLTLFFAATVLARWHLFFFLAAAATTIPAAFALALLSWRWIERPFVALGRRLDEASAAPSIAAEAATAT